MFLRANLTPDHKRTFFATGERYVAWILKVISERLVPHFSPMTTLDYGCGVGRLTIALAKRPGHVVAVDRSPTMLAAARIEAADQGAGHIEFRTPDELAADGRAFDLINCYGVLQGLPETEGLALLDSLVGRLGADGVGVFHVPFRSNATTALKVTRWMRERVPGANRLANQLRGRPAGDPFSDTHIYDLHRVFQRLEERFMALFGVPLSPSYVFHEAQDGFASVILFVQTPPLSARRVAAPKARDEGPVDVRRLVATTSVESLNESAEQYFAALTDWEFHLTKPFSSIEPAPGLLMDVARLLQGLRLTPGATVLDFGAGSGWLARFLSQLGCRVVLLDVSPTALRIARELFARQPIIGDRPAPRFLPFDGRRIDLPDQSVDRIVSFHAFHHAPNPGEILRELGRVLTPGGIAGFAEPGPRHSEHPPSQFDMKTHGVVENDIDIHELWRIAQTCGFTDLQMSVYHAPPFHIPLRDFEDLLAGGPAAARWADSTRQFLRHARSFYLFKGPPPRLDSTTTSHLGCQIEATIVNPAIADQPILVDAVIRNTGDAVWLPSTSEHGGVVAGGHLYTHEGALLTFDFFTQAIVDPPREILPGESVRTALRLPPLAPGRYIVEIDCVARGVAWFGQVASRPVRVAVETRAGSPTGTPE